jgi:hypothetical protein
MLACSAIWHELHARDKLHDLGDFPESDHLDPRWRRASNSLQSEIDFRNATAFKWAGLSGFPSG